LYLIYDIRQGCMILYYQIHEQGWTACIWFTVSSNRNGIEKIVKWQNERIDMIQILRYLNGTDEWIWINDLLKDFQYDYGKIKHNLQTQW